MTKPSLVVVCGLFIGLFIILYPRPAAAACGDPAAPGVDWTGCDKRSAQLAFANLTGANLTDADLSDADLSNATLTAATVAGLRLNRANLSNAVGLPYDRTTIYEDTICPRGWNSNLYTPQTCHPRIFLPLLAKSKLPDVPGQVCLNYVSSDTPKPIPDADLTGVRVSIAVPDSFVLTDVNTTLNISHTWTEDLAATLIAPSRTEVKLFENFPPISTAEGDVGFIDTIFDDAAAVEIVNGMPPFVGPYRPIMPLSVLNGQSSSGIWQLLVVDSVGEDFGAVQQWSLQLCYTN